MHTDDKSCATRLLSLLGVRSVPRERFADVDKVGVWTVLNQRLILLSWHVGMVIDSTFEHVNSDGHPSKCLEIMIQRSREFAYSAERSGLCGYYIHIFNFRDHVSFAIKTAHLKKYTQTLLACDTTTPIHETVEAFSPPTGRAGGKVFVTPRLLKSIGNPTILQCALATKLKENLHRLDWEQIMVTGMILLQYLNVGAGDVLWYLITYEKLWDSKFLDAVKILKDAHVETRIKHKLPNVSIHYARSTFARPWARSLYGLDTLPGRSEKFNMNFQSEQLMRMIDTSKRAWPAIVEDKYGNNYIKFFPDKYTEQVKQIARKTAEDLIQSQTNLETFTEFFSNRMFWGASGGAPGASVHWDDTKEKLRVNKRGALLSLKEQKARNILEYMRSHPDPKPIQWSVKAVKYESGKLRSILNTVLENYVIQGYIFNAVDTNSRRDSWYANTHDNPSRIANAMRRILDLKQRPGLMWDYADFNLNHTFFLMSQEYLARVEVLLERCDSHLPMDVQNTIRADMRAATAYAILARYNTYLHDPETMITTQAVRSLQSGERGTSSINSDSNETDTTIVRRVCKEMLGIDPIVPVTDHAGDDAFENVISMTYAPLVCSVYNLTGAAGQAYKIAVSYATFNGASGEFLRLSYDAASNHIAGYPIRGMMGFIHGEFFAEALPQPFDRLASFLNQRNKLQRRGWVAPDSLFNAVCRYNTRLTYTLSDGTKRHFYPDIETVLTPAAFGGVGVDTVDSQLLSQLSDKQIVTPLHANCPYDAIVIPSGEGKTTLARKYPDIFVDHDSLVSSINLIALRSRAVSSGNWEPLNAYLRGEGERYMSVNRGKILLTWSPSTAPSRSRICALLLQQPVGLRANIANRSSIMNDMNKKYVHMFKNYSERDAYLMSITAGLTGLTYKVYQRTGDAIPKFNWPRVDSKDLLHRSKTVIKDHATLHRHNLPMDVSITDAIAQSALSGAWPKDALYKSIAEHARQLAEWARKSSFEYKIIAPLKLCSDTEFVAEAVSTSMYVLGLSGSLNHSNAGGGLTFVLNDLLRPATKRLKHHYNYIPTLTRLCGCSVNASTQYLIKCSNGDNLLEKILSLMASERSFSHSKQRATKQFDEVIEFIDRLGLLKQEPLLAFGKVVSPSLAEAWFTGGLQLLPPAICHQSADLSTFVRDITLNVIETHFLARLNRTNDLQQIVVTVHHYERMAQYAINKVLNGLIPGIIMQD
ncbi:RNA-dependent RNA polymerase [Trichoderma atroviride mycovirus]|uniref:RNA-directed RNA polymerase n=1 Tax=Trichoderma atroviride mycovirus TaxID=1934322 RepID=A0A1P8DF89_9VIRU|nr:RNA-dependent RNA polymerase [Trichoderma atroviride mycovirus]APU87540.1 RNA-dependent RNA polymerase [Trichoderma atroviride mycovirus]